MEKFKDHVREMFKEFAGQTLQFSQLDYFLDQCGFEKQPGFKIRELASKYDKSKSGSLELDEFMQLFDDLDLSAKYGVKLLEMIKGNRNLFNLQSSSKAASGTKHSASEEEIIGMSQYVNLICHGNVHLKNLLPIAANTTDLFEKVNDGLLMCVMVNKAVPGTIDERALNLKPTSIFQKQENHTLMLNSVASIGIHTINMDSQVMMSGVPHLVLGLVWQVVKKYLLSKINLTDNPHLSCLLREGESLQEFLALPPEEILIRWVNYQLKKADHNLTIKNLGSDMKDSEVYAYLLHTVGPKDKIVHQPLDVMTSVDIEERAKMVIENAEAIDLPKFLVPKAITSGNPRLNLAFIATIFNVYPNLEVSKVEVPIIVESREEKMYRNWMNSLGANPFVYHLYNDLNDGKIMLFLMNQIKPGHVPESAFNNTASKLNNNMKILETCNSVIKYAQSLGINTTTCSGSNIRNAGESKELFLGIIWQLMRAYTVSVLINLTGGEKKMDDKTIIQWANSMVEEKYHISSFSDSKLKDSEPIAKLILAICPNSLNLALLKSTNETEDLLANAKYVVSIARKIGAKVYALPEDIVDLKSKMIMTIYACLMTRYLQNKPSE